MAPLHLGNPADAALIGLVLGVTYLLGSALYNVFLSPLRKYPGPLLCKISQLPMVYWLMKGKLPKQVAALQEVYGPVVRLAPNQLAYADVQAWKDIYGHRAPGQEEFPKYEKFYRAIKTMAPSLITEPRDVHSALRRQLAHGFSEKSMRAQEPIIGSYVDLLIERLHEKCNGDATVLPMRDWYNFTTFDIIGDLGFGSPFGSLNQSNYHPWIRIITDTFRQSVYIQSFVAVFGRTLPTLAFQYNLTTQNKHVGYVNEKLRERVDLGAERPDFIEGLIRKKDELDLDFPKLSSNANVLIVAGSETTATLLSGATFLLTSNKDKYERLVREVRSTFTSEEEITLTSVGQLTYMLAVLNESLRVYPPVVTGLPRVSPKGGANVAGKFVPEGTVVAVWQWAINHRREYWTEPQKFAPERWMDETESKPYKGDQLDAMQPFSVGPRNCIGRNLAYAEMRLILARVMFNFDMELDESSRGWLKDQKMYTLWDKPSLNVRLTPVKHS